MPSAPFSARHFLPSARARSRLLAGLGQDPEGAARFLLGQILVRRVGLRELAARIVETEAYLGAGDPAAHAFRGRTARTEPLWGPAGTLYIYFVYGLHHCLNLAVDAAGVPGCVLIRAAEIRDHDDPKVGQGPARLCRVLDLDTRLSGRFLFDPTVGLTLQEGRPPDRIGVSARIGIRRAADWPLRFFDAESPAVSRERGRDPRQPM